MDWAVFARNGSDVTSFAIQVAREHTHRPKIILARGEYHGVHAWCNPGHGGLLEEDRRHVLRFAWNDAGELRDLVRRNENDVAAVMLTPFHHPAFADSALPAPGFYNEVRRICDAYGIVFISDDVRCGFRLHRGGSGQYFGFKPDMICYSKALANGYTISAALGARGLKKAASKVFFTGSFFNSAVELAAALATIDELDARNAIGKMMKTGEMLQKGLKERAQAHGLQVTLSGPPPIPCMSFANETNFLRMQLFSAVASRQGVFFHPHHNWFICAAHEESDIRQALAVADLAFAAVKSEFGG
jgi:glutamate-1-semialdehyde 2,1-aminomutase